MSIHRSRLIAPLFLVATLSSYACDDTDNRTEDRVDRIGPSPISFNGFAEPLVNSTDFFSRGVTLQSSITTPQPVRNAACPTHPPFRVPITIVAGGFGDADLFLSQVQMRFVDRVGVDGGSMVIAQPQLVALFGSTRIPRRGTRSFPLSFPFGCVGQSAGTLSLAVFGRDSRGREMRTSFSVQVR